MVYDLIISLIEIETEENMIYDVKIEREIKINWKKVYVQKGDLWEKKNKKRWLIDWLTICSITI